MKKQLLVVAFALLFACVGAFLRLNAKALSMHTSDPSAAIGPGGKLLGGSITFSYENTSRTAALTDIGLVLLCAGAALFIVAVATWLFVPRAHSTVLKPFPTTEENATTTDSPGKAIPQRDCFKLRWPIWKRAARKATA